VLLLKLGTWLKQFEQPHSAPADRLCDEGDTSTSDAGSAAPLRHLFLSALLSASNVLAHCSIRFHLALAMAMHPSVFLLKSRACLVDGETKWRTRDALMSRLVRNKEEYKNDASYSIINRTI